MSSWLPAKDKACPSCGGVNTAARKSKGWSDDHLTLCAERTCKDCGAIFEPPARAGWAITAMVIGSLFIVMAFGTSVPTISQALSPFSMGRLVKECVAAFATLVIGFQILHIGWRGFRRKEPIVR